MDYRKIGKITQTFGVQGQVMLAHQMPDNAPFLDLEHLFIALNPDSFIPFFPEALPEVKDEGKIAFWLDEIVSPEAAQPLLGKDVYVEKEVFLERFARYNPLEADLEGFVLKDLHSGKQGTVQSVAETAGQLLATVDYQSKEIFIPLAEDFLVVIDAGQKVLEMDLPEGLWNLDDD